MIEFIFSHCIIFVLFIEKYTDIRRIDRWIFGYKYDWFICLGWVFQATACSTSPCNICLHRRHVFSFVASRVWVFMHDTLTCLIYGSLVCRHSIMNNSTSMHVMTRRKWLFCLLADNDDVSSLIMQSIIQHTIYLYCTIRLNSVSPWPTTISMLLQFNLSVGSPIHNGKLPTMYIHIYLY